MVLSELLKEVSHGCRKSCKCYDKEPENLAKKNWKISMKMEVRKIITKDAKDYQQFRRSALINSPILFLENLEEFDSKSLQDISEQIEALEKSNGSFLLGAFDEGSQLMGIIGFHRQTGPRLDHIGEIWGLYVDPKARGQSLGQILISQTIREASQLSGLKQIKLQLEAGNTKAKNLYESFGFKVWGMEPRAVQVDGIFYDDYHMILTDIPQDL